MKRKQRNHIKREIEKAYRHYREQLAYEHPSEFRHNNDYFDESRRVPKFR